MFPFAACLTATLSLFTFSYQVLARLRILAAVLCQRISAVITKLTVICNMQPRRTLLISVATRLLETLAPTVVVESSMWDLARWWMNAGQTPMDTYSTPNIEIARWCKTGIPNLLERVRRVFPSSQVVIRTPPTVLKDPPVIGEAPEALERMAECVRTQLREDEIFDYHQLVDDMLREAPEYRYPAQSIFLHDGRHPGKCAGIKHFHAFLSGFGLQEEKFVAAECFKMSNERLPRRDVSDTELLDP